MTPIGALLSISRWVRLVAVLTLVTGLLGACVATNAGSSRTSSANELTALAQEPVDFLDPLLEELVTIEAAVVQRPNVDTLDGWLRLANASSFLLELEARALFFGGRGEPLGRSDWQAFVLPPHGRGSTSLYEYGYDAAREFQYQLRRSRR